MNEDNTLLDPVTKTAMPFPWMALTGGLGAAFNFISESRNSQRAAELSKYNTDATIAYNRQAADLSWQRNLEQWNRANEYNDPRNQMLRLKRAGLNPMMAYGSGAIGANSAANSPTMDTPKGSYGYQAAMTPKVDVMGLAQSVQSLSMGRAQIDKTKAETDTARSEAIVAMVNALAAEKRIPNLDKEYKANLDTLLANALKAVTSAKLDDQSFQHDLDYRKARALSATTEAQRASKEFKDWFPLQEEMLKMNKTILEQQRDTGDINLKMLKDFGIDSNAPAWIKAILRQDPGLLKDVIEWVKKWYK